MFEFAKEMNFDGKALGNKRTRDKSLIGLFESPANMTSSLKKSKAKETNTKFLSSNPIEICDRLKILLQEKRA